MANNLLLDFGHETIKISPRIPEEVEYLTQEAHTMVMYVGEHLSTRFRNELLNAKVKRVIFNPGSENEELMKAFKEKNVEVVAGCTLVMLRTNQF